MRCFLRGPFSRSHHLQSSARMNREHLHIQVHSGRYRFPHRIWNIMKFKIKKYGRARTPNPAHNFRPCRREQFAPDLYRAHDVRQLAGEFNRFLRRREVQSHDDWIVHSLDLTKLDQYCHAGELNELSKVAPAFSNFPGDASMNLSNLVKLPAILAAMAIGSGCSSMNSPSSRFQIKKSPDVLSISSSIGKPVLTYNLRPPAGTKLLSESGGFIHPFATPKGAVVTDLAPNDHPHHRGIFLGWVEMHSAQDADFWGWGEHAPIKNRRIVNRSIKATSDGFEAENDWLAEGTVLLRERLEAHVIPNESANVLDLIFTLTPAFDITLSRWAFSGFCLRTRKDGKIDFFSPAGPVALPNPSHLKPESDWPDAPWYAAAVTLETGQQFTAAVINHPRNPPTLWHNHRDVHMLNPCIVAPAEVKLTKGKPLVLRYRVVASDGAPSVELLNDLAGKWKARAK